MSEYTRERHEGRHERHERGRQEEYGDGYEHHGRSDHREERGHGYGEERRQGRGEGGYDHGEERRPQYPQGQGGGGYGPPSGPPPGRGPGLGSLGGLDRGDFASDADIDRMIASGELGGGQSGRQGYGGERGQYDSPSGPPARHGDQGRYDASQGPPPDHQSQSRPQGYGSSGGQGRHDDDDRYGSQPPGRSQYDSQQGPGRGYGREQGNAPSGGFSASREGDDRYGGYSDNRGSTGRPGDGFNDQQGGPGQGDRYAHLADKAHEHGDDPNLYRQATQGLHERIQGQRQQGNDYQDHVDAHRQAYGGGDHGPMDADNIGKAAAMEAFKQTAASGGSSAPSGAFQAGGGGQSGPGRVGPNAPIKDNNDAAVPAFGGGGLQDKLMALAMSQAGKLFDQKNGGSGSSGGDPSQGKAQAMQSAAATAMQLFTQYQSKGKLDSGDMMQLVKNLF